MFLGFQCFILMFDDILSMSNLREKDGVKDTQTTVKMSKNLRDDIDFAANDLGISTMEWIRRACQEKLDRDSGKGSNQDEIIEEKVLMALKKMGYADKRGEM